MIDWRGCKDPCQILQRVWYFKTPISSFEAHYDTEKISRNRFCMPKLLNSYKVTLVRLATTIYCLQNVLVQNEHTRIDIKSSW